MARSKYRITESDLWFAQRWIEKKLKNPEWLGEYRTFKASRAYEVLYANKIHDPVESLNQWCESWLITTEWDQLKNAIRASRRRSKNPGTKTVTLSRNAWGLLNYLAVREGCTLSDVIENHLSAISETPQI